MSEKCEECEDLACETVDEYDVCCVCSDLDYGEMCGPCGRRSLQEEEEEDW